MARVIIRFSLNSDDGSLVRNRLAAILTPIGIQNTGTGTWESANVTMQDFGAAMCEFWAVLSNQHLVAGVSPNFAVDHVWIYVDRAGEAAAAPGGNAA